MRGPGPWKPVAAVGLTIFMLGCENTVGAPFSPATITAPTPVTASSVLSGVVFEITPTGRIPVEGATVYLETCSISNCPDIKSYDVRTDKDGGYRIAGVYDGTLNFLWVSDAVYEMAAPMAPGTCPDGCDRVVTVNGETRLDIELVRR
jgi:hypothetical protein